MGSRLVTLSLTNRSDRTCVIYGYGGIQLLDSAGHAVLTHQVRDRRVPPRRVVLSPGESARSSLFWHAFAFPGEPQAGNCEPAPSYLLVTPPDEYTSLRLTWPEGPVCNFGEITQTAYVG